jgi:hypothetical protein
MAFILDQMMRRGGGGGGGGGGNETMPDISFTFEPLFPPPMMNTATYGLSLRDLQRSTECIVLHHTTEEEREEMCSICRANLVEGDVARRILHCHHVFHQRCIDDWLAVNTTCPICRTNLVLPPSLGSQV